MVEEKEKKKVELITDVVTLIVVRNVPDLYCTMKLDAPLQKLFESYCKTHGIKNYRTLRFTDVEGEKVRGDKTARDLCLENGSVLDAWVMASGGGAA